MGLAPFETRQTTGTGLTLLPPRIRVDAHLADLLRPVLLGDVVENQVPELDVVIDRVEFEVAVLEPDSLRALLARGIEGIEVDLAERHFRSPP